MSDDRIRGDDHHLVADGLDDHGLRRQRRLHRLHEALDEVERLLVALLLRVAGEAREVDEAERHLDPAELARPRELGLHVAHDVLLDEEPQVPVVDVLHERSGERHERLHQVLHLLGHLERPDALLDQRLVDVDVEQADLGVRDPPQRLGVDADQLQERDEREARVEDLAELAHRLGVLVGEPVLQRRRRSEQRHEPLDQQLFDPGLLGDGRRPVGAARLRQQVLDEAEGQPALADRRLDLPQGVAPLPHARHNPSLGRGGARPLPALQWDNAVAGPSLEGRNRHPGQIRGRLDRDRLLAQSGSILVVAPA